MRATGLEVADIFRQAGPAYRLQYGGSLSRGQRCVMGAIERCRSAALGGHVEQCDSCGHQRIAYNSCRNRHCPKCQSLTRAQWLENRQADLIPVEYFHVVFTLPETIAAIAYQNKAIVYDILFHATAETLAHGRRHSKAPGRRNRLYRHITYLGPSFTTSPARALRNTGRRDKWRRRTMGRLSSWLLFARASTVAVVSQIVPGTFAGGL